MKRSTFAAFALAAAIAAPMAAMAAEPTLHEVYQAAESGQIKQAEAMMDQVLRDHPNSAKAHFVEAELLAKEGRTDMARAELATAERLSPGLGFAKPEAVRELQARLAAPNAARAATPAAAMPGATAATGIPWGYLILGGLVLAAFIFFMRSLRRPALAPVPAGYGPGGQTFGVPGAGPMAGPGAPGSGIGSGMLGGLATGLAVGAGVAAGEALMHRVLDGGHSSDAAQPLPSSFDAAPGNGYDDMGGADFGVSDGGSWDDGGAGGGDWN